MGRDIKVYVRGDVCFEPRISGNWGNVERVYGSANAFHGRRVGAIRKMLLACIDKMQADGIWHHVEAPRLHPNFWYGTIDSLGAKIEEPAYDAQAIEPEVLLKQDWFRIKARGLLTIYMKWLARLVPLDRDGTWHSDNGVYYIEEEDLPAHLQGLDEWRSEGEAPAPEDSDSDSDY